MLRNTNWTSKQNVNDLNPELYRSVCTDQPGFLQQCTTEMGHAGPEERQEEKCCWSVLPRLTVLRAAAPSFCAHLCQPELGSMSRTSVPYTCPAPISFPLVPALMRTTAKDRHMPTSNTTGHTNGVLRGSHHWRRSRLE